LVGDSLPEHYHTSLQLVISGGSLTFNINEPHRKPISGVNFIKKMNDSYSEGQQEYGIKSVGHLCKDLRMQAKTTT
jgi:hypothetical protein